LQSPELSIMVLKSSRSQSHYEKQKLFVLPRFQTICFHRKFLTYGKHV
jgi:hypothetical protein